MKIAITGGIGCGKSQLGASMARLGFKNCDVDLLVRDFLAQDVEVITAIADHFGADYVNENGVDRAKLGQLVFGNASERAWLEHLIHPRVHAAWAAAIAAAPDCNWCVEIPLLFEKKLEKQFDFTVCVMCSQASQLQRLVDKGLRKTEAYNRIASQMPLAKKADLSDFIILNEGSRTFFELQIHLLALNLTSKM